MAQDHVAARPWEFDSPRAHHAEVGEMAVPGDLNSSVRKDVQVRFLSSAMPPWWNGSHAWLKPRWPQGRGGSIPPGGTFFLTGFGL